MGAPERVLGNAPGPRQAARHGTGLDLPAGSPEYPAQPGENHRMTPHRHPIQRRRSQFSVAASSLRYWPRDEVHELDLVFLSNEDTNRRVAVTLYNGIPVPGGGWRSRKRHEVLGLLEELGFQIEEDAYVPEPTRTVNADKPIVLPDRVAGLLHVLGEA